MLDEHMPDTPPPVRVLHLEDNPRDAEFVRDILDAAGVACEIVHVNGQAGFESALAGGSFDVVICDFNLPDLDGLAALKLARAKNLQTPVIIVSGSIDSAEAVACLQEGATDYLLKARLERLPSALKRAVGEAATKRRQSLLDTQLRESEERYRQLVESASEIFYKVVTAGDPLKGDVQFVSWSAERITGHAPEDFIRDSRLWVSLVHPDDLSAMLESTSRLARLEPVTRYYRVRNRAGEYRWIEDRVVPFVDTWGAFAGYQGVCRDVTEPRAAQEALAQSEAFARAVVDSLHQEVVVLDAQGVVVAVNQGWVDFARENGGDWTTIEPVGTNYLHAVQRAIDAGDTTAQVAVDGVRSVMHGGRDQFEMEYGCHGPNQRRWFVMRVRRRSDDRGGVVITHQDTTTRVELESQFRQVQKMESVGRLAGGIAHDFNNLLTVINGTTDLALSELGDVEAVRSGLNDIRVAGEQAAALTGQLLAFSRKQLLQTVVLNLNTIVTGMTGLLERLVGENIHLVLALAEDVNRVRADAGQIAQVVVNLAVNARDAMPDGGTLTISTRNATTLDERYLRDHGLAAPTGPFVVLTIADTGTGMDDVTRAQIFEPFFTTKAIGRGTGLGLSTVYGIVKQSGGYVFVDSEVGRGTSFEVCLPQVAEAMDALCPKAKVVSTSGTETILLVEDNEGLRRLAARIIERAGYHVLPAASGEEALLLLERLGESPLDLLLTDVVLPGMNGRVLAGRVGEARPATKVLYMSGYTDDAILQHGILTAGAHFINKPFTAAGLLPKVREVLDA